MTKLYYGVDDIAQTGDPLVDVEVEGEAGQGEQVAEVEEAAPEENTSSKRNVKVPRHLTISEEYAVVPSST